MTKRYCFIGACPSLTGHFVNYVRDLNGSFGHVRDISYRTFSRHVGPDFIREWRREHGIPLSQDTGISFHKSRAPSGLPVYYFVWSAMEHVFVPCRAVHQFDLEEETQLAQAAEDEVNYRDQGDRLNQLGLDRQLNYDGTVTLYHGTPDAGAATDVIRGKRLLSIDDDPYVYLTTDPWVAATAYGPAVLAVDVYPTQLEPAGQPGRYRIRTSYGGVAYIPRARAMHA